MMKKWIWLGLLFAVTLTIFFLHRNIPIPAWERSTSISVEITNNGVTKIPQIINIPRVSDRRLFAHIKALNFERYTDASRSRVRDYISKDLKASGWTPVLQSYEGGINIVAHRPGTNPEAGKILVAAHYDTVLRSPGADDNASGVAAVLEIARLLGKRPTPRTLEVAFFDREELGLLGSLAFTNNSANLTDLRGAIIMDMIAFACRTPGCQRYPENLPITGLNNKGDFLAVAGDLEHLPLLNSFSQSNHPDLPPVLALPIPLKGIATPDILRSDHAPFWLKGIGAVLVTDTANFRTPHYHQPSDTPETIDRKFFVGSAQIITNATAALLESRESLATKYSEDSAVK